MLLDKNLQTVGAPFMTICRNVSTGGVTFISDHRIEAKNVAIQFPKSNDKSLQVAVKILRQYPFEGFFKVTGRFVTRIYV